MFWLMIIGVLVVWVVGGGGGYVSWDQFLLRFIVVFIGVGGAFVLNILGICRVFPMMATPWTHGRGFVVYA